MKWKECENVEGGNHKIQTARQDRSQNNAGYRTLLELKSIDQVLERSLDILSRKIWLKGISFMVTFWQGNSCWLCFQFSCGHLLRMMESSSRPVTAQIESYNQLMNLYFPGFVDI